MAEQPCRYDHDTSQNATWYGGSASHDYYHCDACGARISVLIA